jgi:hypothetical protein
LKSSLVALKDDQFARASDAAASRKLLLDQYVATFRHVEVGALDQARSAIGQLADAVAKRVVPEGQHSITQAIETQRARIG